MTQRTPSGVSGTRCGVCGRSKADEPDQFRIRRRRGREALNWICKPCEADRRRERKAALESSPLRCSVGECGRAVRAAGWCEAHYQRLRKTGEIGPAAIRRRGTGDEVCKFEGCGRPHLSRGLCGAHYQQWYNDRPLGRVRPKRDPAARDEAGRKLCGTCEVWLPLDRYHKNAKTSDGLATVCRRCQRSVGIKRRFGITQDQYEQMLSAQSGGCATCGKSEQENGRMLAVDHDHACCPDGEKTCGRCVRGLLCNPCNLLLGLAGDDVSRLAALIQYLDGNATLNGRPGRAA